MSRLPLEGEQNGATCCSSAICCGTEPFRGLKGLNIVVLSIFLRLKLRQRQYRADRGFTLNMNVWLPLFWRIWTRPHVLAWSMGLITAIV